MAEDKEAIFIAAVMSKFPANLRPVLEMNCPIKVVDIGANPIDGPCPYQPLLSDAQTQVVGFEPNLDALAKLNRKKGAGETYLPFAIGDGRRHTLNHTLLPGMTSLLEPNPSILQLFYGFNEWARVVRREEIDTVRLDDVPETAGLDLLKIDIQGAELMVFENAPQRLAETLVIHTEVEFLQMYVDQPLFSDVERCLRAKGFLLHKFSPLVTRDFAPLLLGKDPYVGHSQVFWADAIFVRDFTRLDLLSDDQLLKMAVILFDCYRAHDLVLHLLREHDRRAQKGYGARFFNLVRPLVNVPNVG
jgi:FkbM family methyltransferase